MATDGNDWIKTWPPRTALPKSAILFLACLTLLLSGGAGPVKAEEKAYRHLVVLGDPHLPGKYLESKERVLQTLNSWDDVDMVVAVGDICEDLGTREEYAAAKKFFGTLNKPFSPVAGNHDFLYDDFIGYGEKRKKLPFGEAKLRRFREAFALPNHYYSKRLGGYLLVILSPDRTEYLSQMSDEQLEWFRLELEKNRETPTIVFFHAPLKDTLRSYNKIANTPDFIAQPHETIRDILMKYAQVFLWVSGHTHTPPKEESFSSAINVYEKRITNIHNTDMNRETIWTNSLFLYPDKVIVKTYNHKDGVWLQKFERTIQNRKQGAGG